MNAGSSVRILIADDHPLIREGLTALLTHGNLCVVAQAHDGQEAVAFYRQHRPDVAVLDVRMPGMSGLDALRRIRAEFPQANVVILSTYDEEETVAQAMQAGARAYLLKEASLSELRYAVEEAAQGRVSLSAHVTDQLARRIQSKTLTPRELEVLQAMVQGKSNAQIGSALYISIGTVKVHIASILAKMGADDRTQAVVAAIRRGLVPLDETG